MSPTHKQQHFAKFSKNEEFEENNEEKEKVDGAKKFWSGNQITEDAALESLP